MEIEARYTTYRLAQRTFRYPVYLALEMAWVISAVFALAPEFFKSFGGWNLVPLLTALAIAHSGRMTMTHPWLLLKSVILGALAFGVGFALQSQFSAPSYPLSIAAVIASGHYLMQGERWTRDRARQAMNQSQLARAK